MAIDSLFKSPQALEMTTARCSSDGPALFNMIPCFLWKLHSSFSGAAIRISVARSPFLHRFAVLGLEAKDFTHDLTQLIGCSLLRESGIKKSPKDSVTTFDLIFLRLDMA